MDLKESWIPKNWCFCIVVLGNTLESLLDCKEIKLVYHKGKQAWVFIGRTDAEAEAPIFWLPDLKNWLIGKDYDAGKDWRQEEKGTTEDKTMGCHHWFNGHEFEQALRDSEGQGSLMCCSPWGYKELDLTEWLSSSKQHSGDHRSFRSSVPGTGDKDQMHFFSCITTLCLFSFFKKWNSYWFIMYIKLFAMLSLNWR